MLNVKVLTTHIQKTKTPQHKSWGSVISISLQFANFYIMCVVV